MSSGIAFAPRFGSAGPDTSRLWCSSGLVGRIALASVAAARRTQSSFPEFLASTNPSDLTMSVYGFDTASSQYSQALTDAVRALPQVAQVESWVGIGAVPLKAD